MRHFLWVLTVVVGLVGCGKKPANIDPSQSVQLDESVSAYAEFIRGDLEYVSNLNFSLSAEEQKTLGIQGSGTEAMVKSLNETVKWVLGPGYPASKVTKVRSNVSYQPQVSSQSLYSVLNGPFGATLAANVGTYYYYKGKTESAVYAFELNGNKVEVKSPSSGIILVTDALYKQKTGFDPGSLSARLERISTLFHEGAHSLGNGQSLGLMHTECPSDHERAGESVCDKCTNGPYPRGGLILKKSFDLCLGCSAKEKEHMRAFMAEIDTRLLKDAKHCDPRPEFIP